MSVSILFGIITNEEDELLGVIYGKRDDVCQTGTLFTMLPLVSIYTVALLAVDRAIYLKKPLIYEQIVTPWRIFFAIVV